jgi:hypothetical protein
MTTIAARFSTLEIAADSQVSGDDIKYFVEKLRRGRESIYGAAGDWKDILGAFSMLEHPKEGDELDEDCDIEMLELRRDGIWVYESTLIPARIKERLLCHRDGLRIRHSGLALGQEPQGGHRDCVPLRPPYGRSYRLYVPGAVTPGPKA